jgi:DNA-binding Lrp family transcriptional regulator
MFDALDLKIVQMLQSDVRKPFSEIARMLGVSPSIVQIRFNRMKKEGLILSTTLVLDPEKFGIKYHASVGVRALETNLEEVRQFLNTLTTKNSKILSWPTFGRYNITALILSKELLEAHKIRQSIKEHPFVMEVSISTNIGWYTRVTNNFELLELEKDLRK